MIATFILLVTMAVPAGAQDPGPLSSAQLDKLLRQVVTVREAAVIPASGFDASDCDQYQLAIAARPISENETLSDDQRKLLATISKCLNLVSEGLRKVADQPPSHAVNRTLIRLRTPGKQMQPSKQPSRWALT